MKETSKSLKNYFIAIGLWGVIGSLLQVFIGVGFFSGIYTVTSLFVNLFYYILAFFFIYFGVEMYRFLKDSPKTLIGFLIFTMIAYSINSFLSGELFSLYFVGGIALGYYLIYNVKKASQEKSTLEEKISKQSLKKELIIVVGILVVLLSIGTIGGGSFLISQKDYIQEITEEMKEAKEEDRLEEMLEELSE